VSAEIDPKTGSGMNPHFNNAIANGFAVTEITGFGGPDARKHTSLRSNIPQRLQPHIEFRSPHENIHSLNFIRSDTHSQSFACQKNPLSGLAFSLLNPAPRTRTRSPSASSRGTNTDSSRRRSSASSTAPSSSRSPVSEERPLGQQQQSVRASAYRKSDPILESRSIAPCQTPSSHL